MKIIILLKKADERGWAPLVDLFQRRTEVLLVPFNPPRRNIDSLKKLMTRVSSPASRTETI
jgi:hypothetical protein